MQETLAIFILQDLRRLWNIYFIELPSYKKLLHTYLKYANAQNMTKENKTTLF